MPKSKYAVTERALRRMTDTELSKYIRNGAKVVNDRKKRFEKVLDSMEQQFSEFLYEYKNLTMNVYDGERETISSGTAKLSRKEKLNVARAINVLSHIEETPKQVKSEVQLNIRDIFKEPRITAEILSRLTDEQIIAIGRDNADFILNILGSERVNYLHYWYKDDTAGAYKQMIQECSDFLDEVDEAEKEKQLEKWHFPEDVELYNSAINGMGEQWL